MIKEIRFFEDRYDLRELTGLPDDNHDEALWKAGFNLDDLDFGIVADAELSWNNTPYYEFWLLMKMENHCVGYEHVEYGGKHYYLVYHS